MVQNGRDPASPNDIDLFLAWTDTAAEGGLTPGPKFQSSAPGRVWGASRKTYRIKDAWLARPGEYYSGQRLQQFMPKVVIDDLGGINLWFLCANQLIEDPPTTTACTVRYARWPSRAALDAGLAPFLWVSGWFGSFGAGSGYDYIGFTTADCIAWGVWAEDSSGTWQVNVVKVILPCPADVDANGTINSADTVAFGNAYLAAQQAADVNHDTTINAQDVTDFVAAFTCGACPIPQP